MPDNTPSAALLDQLRKLDTPTICNALEVACPERRTYGFTTEPLICPFPDLPPIVGFARTSTMRSVEAASGTGEEQRKKIFAYYDYVSAGPAPRIAVIQDIDGARAASGALWGEVNSAIHKALGCLGVVTNGSVRDIPQVAPGFQFIAGRITPSHIHAKLVDFDLEVNVAGMVVRTGDLIHADRHGAAVIPRDKVKEVIEAADLCARREKVILDIVRGKDFSVDKLKAAIGDADKIH
jgi:regulator of RNase E activity RraA